MTPLSSLHQLGYNLFNQSALVFFEEKVLYIIKLSPIKQKYLSTSLVDYLQINAFPDLMIVEREGVYLKFYKQKLLEEPRVTGKRMVGWTQWDITCATSTSAST